MDGVWGWTSQGKFQGSFEQLEAFALNLMREKEARDAEPARRLSFRVNNDGVTPVIIPTDLHTGKDIHGVKACKISSFVEAVTVMELEIVLLNPRAKT